MTLSNSFGIRDWRFELVLHGSRVQLQGHHGTETVSRWLAPTDGLQESVQQLISSPTCCLL
jgi:hypothetical protein